jgi:hypothetical protein
MESDIKNKIDNIRELLAYLPEVEFAYLFGSQVSGSAEVLSDIDIGVYVDMQENRLLYRLKLLERMQCLVGHVPVDLVVLNDAPPVLKYEVIKYGRVLKENKEARVMFETRVLSEFMDTEHLRYTQRMYLKEQLLQGAKCG